MSNTKTHKPSAEPTTTLRLSLRVWGVYLIIIGTLLVVAPNALIGAFGFADIEDNWIRVLGALILNLSLVYWPMARALPKGIVVWTIYSRYIFAGMTIAFALVGWFPANLLIFGAIDAAAATWTWIGTRRAGL